MASKAILKQIGERLRLRRRAMGLTQRETAELLSVSQTFYGEIERGTRSLSIEKIIKVYDKMGIEPTYLLTGEPVSEKPFKEILGECPKEKELFMEQILQGIAQIM